MKIRVTVKGNSKTGSYILEGNKAFTFIQQIENTAKRTVSFPCEISGMNSTIRIELLAR